MGDKFRGTLLNSQGHNLDEHKIYTTLPGNHQVRVLRVQGQPLSFTLKQNEILEEDELDSSSSDDNQEEQKLSQEVNPCQGDNQPTEDEEFKEPPAETSIKPFSTEPSILKPGYLIVEMNEFVENSIHLSKRLMVEFHFTPECSTLVLLSKGFQFEILGKSIHQFKYLSICCSSFLLWTSYIRKY